MGNWSGLIEDDFVLPDGSMGPMGNTNSMDLMHNQFGIQCTKVKHIKNISFMFFKSDSQTQFSSGAIDEKETDEKGNSLFYHENGKTSSNYNDKLFRPNFYLDPQQIIPYNV